MTDQWRRDHWRWILTSPRYAFFYCRYKLVLRRVRKSS